MANNKKIKIMKNVTPSLTNVLYAIIAVIFILTPLMIYYQNALSNSDLEYSQLENVTKQIEETQTDLQTRINIIKEKFNGLGNPDEDIITATMKFFWNGIQGLVQLLLLFKDFLNTALSSVSILTILATSLDIPVWVIPLISLVVTVTIVIIVVAILKGEGGKL